MQDDRRISSCRAKTRTRLLWVLRNADGMARARLMKFAPRDRRDNCSRLLHLRAFAKMLLSEDRPLILRNANPEGAPDVAGAQLQGYGQTRPSRWFARGAEEAKRVWIMEMRTSGRVIGSGRWSQSRNCRSTVQVEKKGTTQALTDVHAGRHGAFDNFAVKQLGRVNHGTCTF